MNAGAGEAEVKENFSLRVIRSVKGGRALKIHEAEFARREKLE